MYNYENRKKPSTAKTMRKKCAQTCGYCSLGSSSTTTIAQLLPIIQLKIAIKCENKSGDAFCAKHSKLCVGTKDSFSSRIRTRLSFKVFAKKKTTKSTRTR